MKEQNWIEDEFRLSTFKDNRLKTRLIKIITSLSLGIGKSIPMAFQDWANTKATYRFLSNKNFTEKESLQDISLQPYLVWI